MTQHKLLSDLMAMTEDHITRANKFLDLEPNILNYKHDPKSWSVLECLEHLNRYGHFYIPEIDRSINGSQHINEEVFKSGLLGNYFAKSMLPQKKLNRMKAFSSMNPNGSELSSRVVVEFIDQQKELLSLLELAKSVSLNKNKTTISISKWIKLKLGDTFRVVIYHNLRHIEQAERTKDNINTQP